MSVKLANSLYQNLRYYKPQTKAQLRDYVKVFIGIDVPDKIMCVGHSSPMDYLWHSFSEKKGSAPFLLNGDCIIWANRGGGKTELGAVATLLDCIFKPKCQVRILGGSFEQSGRMFEYLAQFINNGYEGFLSEPIRKNKCSFKNGSMVEVMTQSAVNVRGRHIHKLRCDEIELFDDEVFAAAQFVTKSYNNITAAMELMSTMHRPYGMMSEAVKNAVANNTPIFKWCIWEVIEKCVDRNCSRCPLWNDCGGKAKNANGYLKIDDCITMMQRSSRSNWESEMLCIKPSKDNLVFSEFDEDVHVGRVDYDANLPLFRAMDFGFVNPFVCLWIQVDDQGVRRVLDEYYRSRASIQVHAGAIKERTPINEEQVAATFCDPAGAGKNDVTGTSAVRELRDMGIIARYRKSGILEGIELIRRALCDGQGKSKLIINSKCVRLIEAMNCYHYPDSKTRSDELPDKDGVYDHPIDALRYFFVNYNSRGQTINRVY